MDDFDLTPDPRILVALTHTPLAPLDALCELIDNALDALEDASSRGAPVQFPLIDVRLPSQAETKRGEGSVVVRDNGPGLTAESAELALRAGYSGNKPRGSLGLFGMGFNIASGKLGQVTRFVTTQETDDEAVQAVVDLPELQSARTYRVQAESLPKPPGLTHGTVVEVRGWWPEGNPNHGYISKLSGYGLPTIRRELGQRYSTVLREQGVRLLVGGDQVEPVEHCVWDRTRFVERRGRGGQIPAVMEFNEVLATQTRCGDCDTLIPDGDTRCPQCDSASFQTVDERVRGWFGIQRFDHPTNFGVDLIRNGRAIRIAEKEAFFTYVDEFRHEIKDYPIDSPYGRIVGEVHLDHVPVDFLKQDFQRSSDEWRRAIAFLRGESSLQPNQPNADQNNSPIFRLYQGYRRVRTPGRADLYMGYWDTETDKPKRISRDTEKEYYTKFQQKLSGYYDDNEWWKLVEAAGQRPVPELRECPQCNAENVLEAEQCQVCQAVLIGTECIECTVTIPTSAVACPECGASQVPEIVEPWSCQVCDYTNGAESDVCSNCSKARGTLPPASREHLLASSNKDDGLSIQGFSLRLADGSHSSAIDVNTYTSSSAITPSWQGESLPLIVFKEEQIDVFVDLTHPVFRAYRASPEVLIASELAQYLYDLHRGLLRPPYLGVHSVSNLAWQVMTRFWAESLEDTPERVKTDLLAFFDSIRSQLKGALADRAADLFTDMSPEEQRSLVDNILAAGHDLSLLSGWKESGDYLQYVDPHTIVRAFRDSPALFFDGEVWDFQFTAVPGLSESVVTDIQEEVKAKYLNCLEDCAAFLRYRNPEPLVTHRARASLNYLSQRLL